ncbi:uncharacterized protein LODBEIA_P01870 [Lodderomyces beijingensis]|uniref:Uncharacterized protein n=1 Tax=Lodderomyces beijingensis TaxID=1775926 RepID=A0ABP0ZCQ8_9ASCO
MANPINSQKQTSSPPKRSTARPRIQPSTATITQRQLSHLNSQIAQLQANLADFNDLIKTTTQQYQSLEQLGKIQASLFMASHKVFEDENFADEEE